MRKRHCPHISLRGIYGDEANQTKYRLECRDCYALLDGPVILATIRDSEGPLIRHWERTH